MWYVGETADKEMGGMWYVGETGDKEMGACGT
jgi:hypothetical protein